MSSLVRILIVTVITVLTLKMIYGVNIADIHVAEIILALALLYHSIQLDKLTQKNSKDGKN